MALLVFKVNADYEKVTRLREEIVKLKAELKGTNASLDPQLFNTLNERLQKSSVEFKNLTSQAEKAGIELENGFRKKIYDSSSVVNELTKKIIEQKDAVKNTAVDVRRLGDAYRALPKNTVRRQEALKEYNSAKMALDEEKAALFQLQQQQASARLSVKELKDEYALYKNEAGEAANITDVLGKSFKKTLATLGIGYSLKSLVSNIVKVRGEFQATETAINTLLGGDMEKSQSLISEIREFAKVSPLEFKDVTAATQMMLGFNIEAEKVPRFLRAIGDVSMGQSGKFNSLTLAFSQMSAAGKLMGQDLNQMINAGFNPLSIMSEKTGKSIAELKDEMSKGAISAEMVQQAFIDATEAGGKFYNMSENASKTINGQLSMMQDALDAAFNEIGEVAEGVIMGGIKITTKLIENYETIGKILVGLIATYGTYKTAVLLVNAAENGHNIIMLATQARLLLVQKAQALLNKTMLANPYVAAAVALSALVSTAWALSDSLTAAEKAQDVLNKRLEEISKKNESRTSEVNKLVGLIHDETAAEIQRYQAIEKLRKLLPESTKGLSDEEIKTLDATKAKKSYNEELSRQLGLEKQRELNRLYSDRDYLMGSIESGKRGNLRMQNEAKKDSERLKVVNEQIKKLEKEKKDFFELRNKTSVKTTYQEDLEKAKKDWEEAKKALEDIEKDKSKFTTKQYETAKAAKDAAEKRYKNLGGKTDKTLQKEESEAEKLNERLLSLRRKNQQDEVALMNEGTGKKLSQIEADFKAQKQKIEKEQKEFSKANKKLKTAGLNDNGLTKEQQNEIDKANKLNEEKREKSEREIYESEMSAMRDYLKEYGTFQQQKLAIAEKYAEKIKKAQNEGERLSLEKQKESAIRQVDINAIKQEIDWQGLLTGFGGMLQEQIKPTIDRLTLLTQSKEFQSYDLEQQSVIFDLITQLQSKLGVGLKQSFINLGEAVEEHRKALLNQEAAEREAAEATEKYNDIVREKTISDENGNSYFDERDPEIVAAREAMIQSTNALSNANNEATTSINNMQGASQKAAENMNSIVSGLQGLGSGSMAGILNGLNNIANLWGDANFSQTIATGLSKSVGGAFGTALAGPIGGEIVEGVFSLLDLFNEGIENLFSNLIDTVLGAVNGLLDSILNMKIPLAIAKNLKNGVGNILNTVTFGGFNSWISSSNAKEVAEVTERLTNSNERLKDSVDNLKDEMSKTGGWKAIDAAQQAKKDQEQINQQSMDILKAQMGYHGSHHSNAYYWGLSREDYASLNQSLADYKKKNPNAETDRNTVGSLKDIYELTPEQLDYIRTYNIEMWEKMIDQGKYDKSEYWENYADLAGQLEEINEALKETLTQTSFDSLRSSFIDTLMDMDKSAEDFADDFSNYMMKAILNAKISDMLDKDLHQFYDDWAKYAESGNELTKDEQDLLKKQWDEITEQGLAIRDQVAAITGYGSSESSYSQEASSKGFQAMSQDVGEELNGRFTALQISNEEIKNQSVSSNEKLGIMAINLQDLNSVAHEQKNMSDEIRTILANSYLELQQISENTGELIKPIKAMANDIAEVKKNTSRL